MCLRNGEARETGKHNPIYKVFWRLSVLPFSGRMGGKQDWRQEITEDAAAAVKVTEDTARRQVRKTLGSRARQALWKLRGEGRSRPPCASPAPRAHSNSCPLGR